MKKVCAMVLAVAMAAGCTVFMWAKSPGPQIDTVSLGDSIARGYGCPAPKTDCYGNQLVELLRKEAGTQDINATFSYENYGVDGLTSDDVYSQITNDASMQASLKKAELVTVSIGGNNMIHMLTQELIILINEKITDPAQKLSSSAGMDEIVGKLYKDGEMTSIAISVLFKALVRLKSAEFLALYDTMCQQVVDDGNKIVDFIAAQNPDAWIVVTNVMRPTSDKTISGMLDPLLILLNEKLPKIGEGKEANVQIADSFTAFAEYTGSEPLTYLAGLSADGLDPHPTPTGHRLMAQVHLPLVKDLLTETPVVEPSEESTIEESSDISVEESTIEESSDISIEESNIEIGFEVGDVNGDGSVKSIDALWVLESVAGTRVLTPQQQKAADMDGNARITSLDALRILEKVAGI